MTLVPSDAGPPAPDLCPKDDVIDPMALSQGESLREPFLFFWAGPGSVIGS